VLRLSRRRLLAALAALAAGVLVVVVIAVRRDERPAAAPSGARVHGELCEAISSGDGELAAARFAERIHTPLHELADAAQREDRGVAAELLEAKQRVEARLEAGGAQEVVPLLVALEPAVREALAVTGMSTAPCGGRS
jgi:hypothetical protein